LNFDAIDARRQPIHAAGESLLERDFTCKGNDRCLILVGRMTASRNSRAADFSWGSVRSSEALVSSRIASGKR